MGDEAKFSDYPLDVQVALLKQSCELHTKEIGMLTTKVGDLEKSDAVTKEQIGMVFSSIGDIKDTQKVILDKLDKKQEDDIKDSKDVKLLLIGTAFTSIASLIGFFVTNFLVK